MPQIGQTISHFRLIEEIGRGGMGVVYKAEDTKLHRRVALKFLPDEVSKNSQAMGRFRKEAEAASALNHPNIVTIHDIDEVDGAYFIAMEYIEGRTLQELITAGDLNLDQVLDYGIQISDALSKAHSVGIVHRDIKPSNLMITEGNLAKVLDFGLAKLAYRPAVLSEMTAEDITPSITEATRDGKILGTLPYMSPEQAQGREVDHRSDIFSLGVVLYQMIAKNLPFAGPHAAAVLDKLLHSPAPSLRSTHSGVPPALDQVISRALAKNPEDRYQSMQEMSSDLRAVSRGEESISRAPKTRKRRAIALTIAAILVVLLLAFSFRQWLPRWLGGPGFPSGIVLVVLPFSNVGGDPDNQDFCDGLMERLATKLNQIGQFKKSLSIIAPTEVLSEKIASASQARSAFGANMVLKGSIQRMVDSVLLTIYLVDAKSQRQIDGATLSAAAGNTIALENDVFEKAVSMLGMKLNPLEKELLSAGETLSPDAHQAYLQGIGRLVRFDVAENIDMAVYFLQQAVRKDSMYALAHAGLGEAYWRKFQNTRDQKWAEEALNSCVHAVKLDSRVPRVARTLGIVYEGTGRPQQAVEALNQAIKMEPRNAESYQSLGRAYSAMNMIEDSESAFLKAIQLNPDSWSAYWDFGVFHSKRAHYENAAKQFQKVIELEPDHYHAYARLGGIYLYLGNFQSAGEIFSKSLAIAESPQAYSNLAASYILQGRFAAAVLLLEKASLMEGAGHEVWGNLGDAYFYADGFSEKAQPAYERAVELAKRYLAVNPDKTKARAELAFYLIRLGHRKQALEEIARIDESMQADPEVAFRSALVYELAGDRKKAMDILAAAISAGFSPAITEAAMDLKQLRQDPRYRALLKNQTPP